MITILAVIIAAFATMVLIVVLWPATQTVVALAVRIVPLHLLLPALLAITIGVIAWRGRQWVPLVLASFGAVVLIAFPLVSTVEILHTAANEGVAVSLGAYLADPGIGGGTPVRNDAIASVVDGVPLGVNIFPAKGDGPHPALIMIHGGGWEFDSDTSSAKYAALANSIGFTAFDVTYRLSPNLPTGTAWQKEVGDVKCVVSWIASNAANLRVNAGSLHIMGQSAGGQLALMAANTVHDPEFPSTCPTLPEQAVKSVIDLYGITDLTAVYRDTLDKASLQPALRLFIGGTPEQYPARYADSSPINHVTTASPPTLMVYGGDDTGVIPAQARAMAARLTAVGVRHHAVFIPLTPHAFDTVFGNFQTQITRGLIVKHLTRYR